MDRCLVLSGVFFSLISGAFHKIISMIFFLPKSRTLHIVCLVVPWRLDKIEFLFEILLFIAVSITIPLSLHFLWFLCGLHSFILITTWTRIYLWCTLNWSLYELLHYFLPEDGNFYHFLLVYDNLLFHFLDNLYWDCYFFDFDPFHEDGFVFSICFLGH